MKYFRREFGFGNVEYYQNDGRTYYKFSPWPPTWVRIGFQYMENQVFKQYSFLKNTFTEISESEMKQILFGYML